MPDKCPSGKTWDASKRKCVDGSNNKVIIIMIIFLLIISSIGIMAIWYNTYHAPKYVKIHMHLPDGVYDLNVTIYFNKVPIFDDRVIGTADDIASDFKIVKEITNPNFQIQVITIDNLFTGTIGGYYTTPEYDFKYIDGEYVVISQTSGGATFVTQHESLPER